jgi:hypothetical protein
MDGENANVDCIIKKTPKEKKKYHANGNKTKTESEHHRSLLSYMNMRMRYFPLIQLPWNDITVLLLWAERKNGMESLNPQPKIAPGSTNALCSGEMLRNHWKSETRSPKDGRKWEARPLTFGKVERETPESCPNPKWMNVKYSKSVQNRARL